MTKPYHHCNKCEIIVCDKCNDFHKHNEENCDCDCHSLTVL